MATAFQKVHQAMVQAFREMERLVPPPSVVTTPTGGGAWRYSEQSIHQAIILKLARQISGLQALDVLLRAGLFQEQAVIQRTLDEVGEDILFLAVAATKDDVTPLHIEFLRHFWAEEFDTADPLDSAQKRGMIPRHKIRAFSARAVGLDDPSSSDKVGRIISKVYSGYVHAAAPQVSDMIWGDPPLFCLDGMRHTLLAITHVEDAWSYYYRGLLSAALAAKGFGDASLVARLYAAIDEFEAESGTRFLRDARSEEPSDR